MISLTVQFNDRHTDTQTDSTDNNTTSAVRILFFHFESNRIVELAII